MVERPRRNMRLMMRGSRPDSSRSWTIAVPSRQMRSVAHQCRAIGSVRHLDGMRNDVSFGCEVKSRPEFSDTAKPNGAIDFVSTMRANLCIAFTIIRQYSEQVATDVCLLQTPICWSIGRIQPGRLGEACLQWRQMDGFFYAEKATRCTSRTAPKHKRIVDDYPR